MKGSDGLDFVGLDRSSRNEFVRPGLVKFEYGTLGRADKGLVKRFLGKATGLSLAQLTRLVRQRVREPGGLRADAAAPRRGRSPRRPQQA